MQNFDDLDIEGRHPSHLSEEEREKEEINRKCLMRCSVTAEDGTLRPVYSHTDDGDVWCHICNIALFGAHKLQNHNTSSRHKIKLDEWPYPVSLWSKRDALKISNQGPTPIPDTLAPGEPVPPGMEDQMTRSTTIQVSLDRHQSSPLVGLEYLLELVDNDSCEPSYTCVLCDKRGDPRTVMAHITSYNHRITYLNRHFPTISRAITELPRTPNYKRGANEISVLVAKKIEEKFGRLHPQLVDKSQFEKNKIQYIKNVYQDYHFRETPELTFMDVYDVRWVTHFDEKLAEMNIDMKKDLALLEESFEDRPKKEEKIIDKAFPKKIEPDTSKSLMKIRILTKDKLHRKPEKDDKKKRPSDDTKSLSSLSSISSSPSPDRSRSRSRSRSRRLSSRNHTTKYRHSKSSRHVRSRSRSRSTGQLRERDKWDKFREQIRRAEETLDRALKFHEKNPEKHPSYPDEWKKFWNRRYKELQAEGKDPSKHDFKPEWIEFWNKRMREIHNEQLASRKEEIRKRLELPEDKPPEAASKWTSSSRGEKRSEKEDRPSPKRARHHVVDSDDDVEYVGTKTIKPERPILRERDEYRDRHDRERELARERDLAYAYSREKISSYRSYYPPPIPRAPITRSRHYSSYVPMKEKSPSPVLNEDPLKEDLEIVGLLRLLTALEGQLGSLGPKIVTLLSRALAAEKAKPNSAEELLYDEEVSVLFETVKEKLKGQLFANMIEKMAIAATKSAIQNIAQLLHRASEEKRLKEEEEEKKKKQALEMARSIAPFSTRTIFPRTIDIPQMKSEPVSVPGVGSVDKVAIAQQIAAALVAQGRTNVSQDELETLINAVVGMAEASQRSDKPVTAANFVKSLTAANSQPTVPEMVTPVTATVPTPAPPPIAPPVIIAPIAPEKSRDPTPPPPPSSVHVPIRIASDPIEAHAKRMENLTDNDLKNLLQNFKELGTDEQHGLINFLKKLEASDPGRVEKLRAFVNLGSSTLQHTKPETPTSNKDIEEIAIRRESSVSPFSARKGGHNPTDDADHLKWKPKLDMFADDEEEEQQLKKKKEDERIKGKLELSDDDDDYTFEDIYKAADKNVSENEKAKNKTNSRSNSTSRSWSQSRSRSRSPITKKDAGTSNNGDPTAILNETKRLIANIMGDLPNKYVVKSHINSQQDKSNSPIGQDVVPPGSTNVTIPTIGYPHNYLQQHQQQHQQQPHQHQHHQQHQQHNHHQQQQTQQSQLQPQAHQQLPYTSTIAPNQFTNYQQPPQQSFNNAGYMNNMTTNMAPPMSNMNNGYNYNQSLESYSGMNPNQGQYGGPPPPSLQPNQFPHLYGAPPQYNAPTSAGLPMSYPPQNQYGNYSQHPQRFY